MHQVRPYPGKSASLGCIPHRRSMCRPDREISLVFILPLCKSLTHHLGDYAGHRYCRSWFHFLSRIAPILQMR